MSTTNKCLLINNIKKKLSTDFYEKLKNVKKIITKKQACIRVSPKTGILTTYLKANNALYKLLHLTAQIGFENETKDFINTYMRKLITGNANKNSQASNIENYAFSSSQSNHKLKSSSSNRSQLSMSRNNQQSTSKQSSRPQTAIQPSKRKRSQSSRQQTAIRQSKRKRPQSPRSQKKQLTRQSSQMPSKRPRTPLTRSRKKSSS